jgi:hypothetical protein
VNKGMQTPDSEQSRFTARLEPWQKGSSR